MGVANGDRHLVEEVKRLAFPLEAGEGFETLIEEISGARIVMLGAASHGTEEFYEWRRRISARLISEHGFRFVAVEGDWPACWRVNQFATGRWKTGLRQAFGGFHRWPTWMWANSSVVKFVEWLHSRNARFDSVRDRAGFYGLDVYSLFESVDAILKGLHQIDRDLVPRTKELYECLEVFRHNEKAYARSLGKFPDGCEVQVTTALKSLLHLRLEADPEWINDIFNVEQNAHVVKDAELYYRTMVRGMEEAWNVRDRHMLDTLARIMSHHGPAAKGIVWAHNQHVGDYRGSSMRDSGQVSLGGLAREKWGQDKVALLGMGTFAGETLAASAWGGQTERMTLTAARPDSYDAIFHAVAKDLDENNFVLPLRDLDPESKLAYEWRVHRSIGVVYSPRYELQGNYISTSLAKRFDAFLHVDRTTSLGTLAQTVDRRDMPEAWPSGI